MTHWGMTREYGRPRSSRIAVSVPGSAFIVAICLQTTIAWLNMRDAVLGRMNDVRNERLKHEFLSCLAQRWPVMAAVAQQFLDRNLARNPERMAYGVNIADLALQEEFECIMCEPTDVVIDSARFLALENKVNAIIKRWVDGVKKQFRAVAQGSTPRSVNALALATTVFATSPSGAGYQRTFPAIIAPLRPYSSTSFGHTVKSIYAGFARRQRELPFELGPEVTVVTPEENMLRIVQMCGKDPRKATAKEMDALDTRFVVNGHCTTNWRGAVSSISLIVRTVLTRRALVDGIRC